MRPLPVGKDLRKRAEELGVVIYRDDPNEPKGVNSIFREMVSEAELQKRVVGAEQHLLSRRLWIISVIASVASALSAAAAWCAVLMK